MVSLPQPYKGQQSDIVWLRGQCVFSHQDIDDSTGQTTIHYLVRAVTVGQLIMPGNNVTVEGTFNRSVQSLVI